VKYIRGSLIRSFAKEMTAVFVVPRIAQNLRIEKEYSKCPVADFTAKLRIPNATSYWQLIF
jgi:hypothetical protein